MRSTANRKTSDIIKITNEVIHHDPTGDPMARLMANAVETQYATRKAMGIIQIAAG